MDNRSLAPQILLMGVLGLGATCFMATSAFESASASPEPVEIAAPVSQPVAIEPPPKVEPTPEVRPAAIPAPAAAPAEVAAAPAEIHPTISQTARAETCQQEFRSALKENPIDFGRDHHQMTAKGKSAADKLLVIAKACSGLKIQIQGFTDNEGKKANNTRLSRRRAESVRGYLVAQGLSQDLLTAVGFGPDRPVASNRTASGRARNRRIEIRVTRVES
ncbi:MAG TPA: OmpA family protein [Hyphomonadaceae bacterium]|nr:OmpA family protein [Hyphomonadaceae bacterium]HPN07344.1 OmpA family protein [Hyphomonadaceae bacterium]